MHAGGMPGTRRGQDRQPVLLRALHPPAARQLRRYGRRGLTLAELLVGVAIGAILAAVALPNYVDTLRKGRRVEAFNAMNTVQQAQERYRGQSTGYADSLAPLGIVNTTSKPHGYYSVSLITDRTTIATDYIVGAIAVEGRSQDKDANCRRLAVRVVGGRISYAGCASCDFLPGDFSETNACWAR
jgi:type IV pilus assembly protein PilE